MRVASSWLASLAALAASVAAAQPPSPSAEPSAPFAYIGAGSCSSSSCHGSPGVRTATRVPQNEHTIWAIRDEHARAYGHLLGDRSRLIARNLKLDRPPEKAALCLDCHALNVPEARRGRTFELADGVSCESCHGPGEQWIGPHTTRDWSHARSVELGMIDTKDPLVRAEICSSCHVGTSRRSVTHRLLAAGHPELVFEMQWATASMPRHWRESNEEPFFATRLWAVGEAVHLRDQLARAARAAGHTWPELAEFECGACHHPLRQKSWRQVRGYAPREPGDLPLDLARWRVLAPLVEQLDSEARAGIEAAVATLAREAGRPGASVEAVQQVLHGAAASLDALARRLAAPGRTLERETTLVVLASLASDPGPAREFGYRGAGQIAMSIDALSRPFVVNGGPEGRLLDASIAGLFATLNNPETYDPSTFASALEGVATALPALTRSH